MTPRTVLTIYHKELSDTLRDRRTVIAMLVAPVFLYPVLFLLASQALIVQTERLQAQEVTVAVHGEEAGPVRQWLRGVEGLRVTDSRAPALDLMQGRVQAVVTVSEAVLPALVAGRRVVVTIEYDGAELDSGSAAERVAEVLQSKKQELLEARLADVGLAPDYVDPIEVRRQNVAPKTKMTGWLLGMILPVVMVMMIALGAFYPAVDLTAGEKERGTFETLLSTPVAKIDIVTGKFLAVFCIAMATGILNLASMSLTLWFQLSHLPVPDSNPFEVSLPVQSALFILMTLLPLAFFISAVMMSIAVFARNFREAQNYVTPFFLLLMFPAAFAALPGAELGPGTSVMPVVNVALLFRKLLVGSASAQDIFVVFTSTAAYAVLALVFAAWLFQRDEVMLSDEHTSLFSLWRGERPRMHRPGPGAGMMLFGVTLLLLFYAGSHIQTRDAVWGIAITQWVLILVPPVAMCLLGRIDLRGALQVRLPRRGAWAATLVLMTAWLVLLLQAGGWHDQIFPMSEEMEKAFEELVGAIEGRLGLGGMLLLLALTPAICEEVLFRGAILSSFRGRMPMAAAILLVGVLFGLIHLSVYRIVPTALSGFVLTYVAWRSRSVFPAMLGHLMVNGGALLLDAGAAPGWVLRSTIKPVQDGGHMPWQVLAGALVVFTAGVVLMEWVGKARSRRHRHGHPEQGHAPEGGGAGSVG
jgi:sodium transport system permease protein